MNAPVVCPRCSSPVSATQLSSRGYAPCLQCQAPLRVRIFPALLRIPRPGISAERVTDAGQATCFYHPNKTAHVPCDACGRFICALCEVELHGQHLCPSCVESGRRKGTLTTLESRRVLWDSIALSVAVLPVVTVVLWWTSIIAAPAAIFLAIYGWKKPRSVAPRWSSFRFIAAIVFSVIVLGGWATLFFYMATRSTGIR